MSAIISFKALNLGTWKDIASSGLGFYGSGSFGASVAVGAYQDSTYITDAAGAANGGSGNNIKYVATTSGQVAGGLNLNVLDIPNEYASLNVCFTSTSSVQVRNAELRIYDRVTPANPASGVVTQAIELLHPSLTVSGSLGSGESTWTTPGGVTTLPLAQSPGISGLEALDGVTSTTPDTQHDWYIALSASPSTIGSKTQYGLYVSCEYL